MMHRHVDRYINLHRALGKGFAKHEKSLREFAAFAADRTDPHVTVAIILEWAGRAATPNSAQDRYGLARAFAMFLHAEDAQHEVPVAGLFGRSRRRRPAPHILSQDQISGILAEALLVPGLSPISPQTYHTVSYTHLDVYKRQEHDLFQIFYQSCSR